MSTSRAMAWVLLVAAACTGGEAASGSPDALPAAPDAGQAFTATKQGSPQWETAGWQVFATPDFPTSLRQLWPMHVFDTGLNAFRPGPAHPPPYGDEAARAVAAQGWKTGARFTVADWTYPRSLMWAGAIVPSAGAPSGTSPDSSSGPVIPASIELGVDADLFLGTAVVDTMFDSTYPTLGQLVPGMSLDGSSHLPVTFGEDTSFIAGTPGSYVLHVHIFETQAQQNGWTILIPFTVE